MTVIVELDVAAEAFELGRILTMESETTISVETMVPLGQKAVPFFTVHNSGRETFEESVRQHPSVEGLHIVNEHDDRTLYALDWLVSRDQVFEGFRQTEAQLLSARGTSTAWQFELRFPTHERLSAFQEHCRDADIPMEVVRVFNPTKPDSGPWFGLTANQRTALLLAVESGYYSIPRGASTVELATELGISDQAVTERLRRAIATLVANTLAVDEQDA